MENIPERNPRSVEQHLNEMRQLKEAVEMSNGNYHRGILKLAAIADEVIIETRNGGKFNVNKQTTEKKLSELSIRTVAGTLNGITFIFRPPISGKTLLPPQLSFERKINIPSDATAKERSEILESTDKKRRSVRDALTNALRGINFIASDN